MKKVIKKMNIGVVLAIVLIIATFVYVIVGSIWFDSKRDEIKDFLTGFIGECDKSCKGTRDEIVNGHKEIVEEYFSDYRISDYQAKNNYITDEFICAQTMPDYYNILKEEEHVVKDENGEVKKKKLGFGTVESCKTTIKSISVGRKGEKSAQVTVRCSTVIKLKDGMLYYCNNAGVPLPVNVEYEDVDTGSKEFDLRSEAEIVYTVTSTSNGWKIEYISSHSPQYTVKSSGEPSESSEQKEERTYE